MPRPSPGRRFAPKITMTMARMPSSSGNPSRPMVMLQRIVTNRTMWIVPLFQSLILAVLTAAEPLTGQFSGGVNLVEVYATVTDRSGEPILGLVAEDFTVSEDGGPQRVTT